MENNEILTQFLKAKLEKQRFGVLTSIKENQPHSTLVALVISDDLKKIIFATPRATRKFEAIKKNPNVALFMDDRENKPEDISKAVTISAVGKAIIIEDSDENLGQYRAKYLYKHPYLSDFLEAKETAIVEILVKQFQIVSKFKNVRELNFD